MPSKPKPRRTRVKGEANRSIYERTEATGRKVYEVGVRNDRGNQTFRTVGYKLTEARVERDNLLGRRGRGEKVASNARLTFGQAADQWLKDQVVNLAPNTRNGYRNSVEKHLRPVWGRRRLDRIEADDAARLVAKLREDGYAETTINHILITAGSVFRFAKRRLRWHGENVISLLDSSERARLSETPKRRYFSSDELDQTIAAAVEPWALIFRFAAVTGARQSEVAGLCWEDLDLDNLDEASVTFDYQVSRQGKRGKLKTAKSRRSVEIPAFLAADLAKLKVSSPYSRPGQFAFCTRSGKAISQRNLSRVLRQTQAKAKTPEGKWTFPLLHVKDQDGNLVKPPRNTIPSWHGFRHASASEAIADGESIEEISWRLGHASSTTTANVYAHQLQDAKRSAERRAKLEARYGSRMAAADLSGAQSESDEGEAEVVDLQAKRGRRQ